MFGLPRIVSRMYWALVAMLFAAVIAMVIWYVPTDMAQGPVQKIFYVHLPSAINAFLACAVVFAASIGYAWQRKLWWDDLAVAAAKVAVVLTSVVLLTGMIWGHYAWGAWWTWSPRLTFSLVLWLLYVVYLTTRSSIESPQRRAMVSAVYGIVAFLDVPLVWFSIKLMPADIHPASIAMAPQMKLTLLAWFAPVSLMTLGLIAAGYRLNQLLRTARPRAHSPHAHPMTRKLEVAR